MNSVPGTLRHPDLVALAAAAAAVEDFCRSESEPPLPAVQSGLDGVDADASVLQPHEGEAPQPEAAACSTGDELREWTKAICRGDEAAFTRFYDRYNLRLYRHLLVLAKGNEGEAREVLQTVVLKVAKKFETFDDERRLWGWLCRLARNAYVDLCRVRRRDQRFVPLEEYKSELTEAQDAEHWLSESLHYAMERLPGEDRELMRAAYVDKRPLQELADTSGQTYKAMESRLARLRRKLKATLLNHLRNEERS